MCTAVRFNASDGGMFMGRNLDWGCDGLSWGVSETRLSVVKAGESVEEALDRLAIDEARRRAAGHGGFTR